MRKSGESSLDVEVNSQGEGRYKLSDFPNGQTGTFLLTKPQFAALLKRLERFQREAEPFNFKSVKRIFERTCPKGVPTVTDAGGFWIHWQGPNYNRHYFADFECDFERNSVRNRELLNILQSLPVHLRI